MRGLIMKTNRYSRKHNVPGKNSTLWESNMRVHSDYVTSDETLLRQEGNCIKITSFQD